jgi:Zn-dependent M28 family amino/carboxypeptidase
MSRLSRRVGAVGLAAVLVGTCLGAGTATAVDDVDTKKLRDAVTVNGILQHERAFQVIANNNGGTRASGTDGYLASTDYVTRTLRRAGYTVSRQKFTFPFYNEVTPGVSQQVSPNAVNYETATLNFSGSGDVTGVLVPTNDLVIPATEKSSSTSGCEATDFPTAPAGPAVALVQRGTCTFEVKVDNAERAGYEAVLVFNEGNPSDPTRVGLLTNVTAGSSLQSVPVNGLSYADGVALATAAKAGPVTVRVAAEVEYDPKRETYNVIADSPKGKKADEVVVVGAHLDSVIEGPGINDNGSGTATILEIAEQMAALDYTNTLQRQVRFAFWGAEESGLLGSEYYVEKLSEANRAKIYANLNFDMVGSPNYVRFVYDGDGSDSPDPNDPSGGPLEGPPGSAEIEEIFTDYFASQGLASEPTEFSGRSDYGPFIAAGIPAGGLFSGAEGVKTPEQAAVFGGTAGQPYDPCYHQACDTINNLNTRALFELGDAAAHAVLTLTRSTSGLYPDGSRMAQRRTTETKAKELTQRGHQLVR